MKFFAYRELMKSCESAVFTGLDKHTQTFAAGRALLRQAHGLMAAGKREAAEKLVREYAPGIPDDYLLPYCMHGTVPEEAGMQSIHVPPVEEVLRLFKERGMENKHPRLLADEAAFAEIRTHRDELPYKNWIDALKQRAATFMDAPFAPWVDAKDDLMTKKNYLEPCRMVKVRVQTLAMLYQVTQEERYARRAREEILNFITYPTYYPEHYLNVAEACYALCLGYDWLYDTFTPEERDAIWLAVKEKCFDTANDNMTNCTEWAGHLNNWNQVCNGRHRDRRTGDDGARPRALCTSGRLRHTQYPALTGRYRPGRLLPGRPHLLDLRDGLCHLSDGGAHERVGTGFQV